ncbi:glycosyltransferase family 4 protein [Oceanibacterium hippocampi]|uniref:Alpha-D-kanosaminyltransferase n=1 Tax=Oceanibacterium hippocampi TaxID=745714 RepID=A0A1Y5RLK3_9PROT|nr:glycosyltransferase family 4 protein [Oceanibacterium hippocampi]SLN19923.1 Alpha-D-kanosaminyltransferase [Oceanibacterium hippocampi]
MTAAVSAVAFILKGYPRLSETFIAQEIHALERLGLDIRIVSLRHPTDKARHPVHGEIRAQVGYLPEYLHHEPLRVLGALARVWRRPRFADALAAWWRDLKRDPTRNRVRRFGQALVLAAELDPSVGRLHAHFLHTPASVARYASLLSGLPWSCSAHAKDIWTSPAWEIREKLAELDWLVTCTAANADFLAALAPGPDLVQLVYHGLDLDRFPAPERSPESTGQGGPLRLLTVARAVEKKGLDDLLKALAMLPPSLDWRWEHIGGGPDLPRLKSWAAEAGLSPRISWRGAAPQAAVIAACRDADLFVLPSRIAADGDRDGLPNVLMEAQSQRLACVATAVSAIPELIKDSETGLLVAPDDPAALAAAIERAGRDPDLRDRLAERALANLRENFALAPCLAPLAARFGLVAAPAARANG